MRPVSVVASSASVFFFGSGHDGRIAVCVKIFFYPIQAHVFTEQQGFRAIPLRNGFFVRVDMDIGFFGDFFGFGQVFEFSLVDELGDPFEKIDETLGPGIHDSCLCQDRQFPGCFGQRLGCLHQLVKSAPCPRRAPPHRV